MDRNNYFEDPELVEYRRWMFNPDNEYNCSECPDNYGMRHESGNPCGQYKCWVSVHCAYSEAARS